MGRLANPVSKRATAQLFSDQYGVPISSAALYKMMEHINDEVIERVPKKSLDLTQTLFERRKWFEGLWNSSNQVQIPFIFSNA